MSEHPVIYLAPSDAPEREWCQDDVWENSVRYNLGTDFDRVTAERDAALVDNGLLRENIAAQILERVFEYHALQQRLTAADERADVLETMLFLEVLEAMDDLGNRHDMKRCREIASDIRNMGELKPAEGRGDHIKHYECIGKGGDYTVVAIAQGAGTLKGFNHYVYKNADGVHFVRDPEDFLSRMQIKP